MKLIEESKMDELYKIIDRELIIALERMLRALLIGFVFSQDNDWMKKIVGKCIFFLHMDDAETTTDSDYYLHTWDTLKI